MKKYDQTVVRECVIPFGPKSFVFQFVIQNLKIKIYRTIVFSYCFLWTSKCYVERNVEENNSNID